MSADPLRRGPKPHKRPRVGRWFLIGLAGLAAATAALVGPGMYDTMSFRNSGQHVDIGGRALFLRCQGTGSPTVVLEHGLGSDATAWRTVQEAVAEETRVCVTSRAGMGFSDPIPGDETRTAQDALEDLVSALDGADVSGPYVLVGHSFGGFVVRLFVDEHPDDVVAMVLVDSSHEEQTERQAQLLEQLLSPEAWAEISQAGEVGANPERMGVEASGTQVAAAGKLGDLPLIVLEAGGHDLQEQDEVQQAMADLWSTLQGELASLSTNSAHIVVPDSGHFIQTEQPDVVIDAIRSAIEP